MTTDVGSFKELPNSTKEGLRPCQFEYVRHEAPVWPSGGERPLSPGRRSGRAEAGGSLSLGGAREGGKQPRRRRDASVPPDGAGPASETGRCTRGTSA